MILTESWREKDEESEERKEKTLGSLKALEAISKDLEITMSQLALAWTVKYDNVTTMLLGASSMEQLESNLKAFEHSKLLTPEILEKIE